ncbi:Pentatricopeptide repeat-containing protein [Apostasia shenzhenica]|uniref:Pentatricopeptide repeat-containing protein n=1 Tax=Apostasia shenzhenica TaxID=1088818 RepID=A0A2I0AZH8_9ASPA|nr:Pentatricopeptide repeat-containing protein [Apostasia shenzhenica]
MKKLAVTRTGYLNFQRSHARPFLRTTIPPKLCSLFQSPCSFTHCSVKEPLEVFISLVQNSRKASPSLSRASCLHTRALKAGFMRDWQVCTGFLDLYLKCGSLGDARKMFDELSHRDVLTWTVLISAYVRCGQDEWALSLFSHMLADGVSPNCFTLSSLFKSCANTGNLERGKEIYGWMLRNDIEMDVALQNSIVDFYVKSNAFGDAGKVFDRMTARNFVSWNIMIGAYLKVGDTNGAMELFISSPCRDVSSWNTFMSGQMKNGSDKSALQLLHIMVKIGPVFNQYTFATALVLASKLAFLDMGRQIHSMILRLGFENDVFIKNSLIDMYSKCGKIQMSLNIFDDIGARNLKANTISWSSLIAGFVQNGRTDEAIMLFCRMLHEGGTADRFTLTSIAAACADAGIIEQGRQIHACIEKSGHEIDVYLASAIIDMYAKCGSLGDAQKYFNGAENKNVVLWTSMVGSYALHGKGKEAIGIFEMMLKEDIKPNEISFLCVLSACSHGGLLEEGYQYFDAMVKVHLLVPMIEHLTCMVDLLCRSGQLNEAIKFIQDYNIGHHSVVWTALLSASRVHRDIETAKLASKRLIQIEPHDIGSYVLLSSIYATKREWENASKLWSLMANRGLKKQPGFSWIQIKNNVHTFVAGDKLHPETDKIYSYLEKLIERLKELGYSTRTDLVLHDVEEEQREAVLQHHSEKLAIAYGIISTPSGATLRIMKNLRVCLDCHEAIKYISQVTFRDIVLRDSRRFHHFKLGNCSCGDYW